MPRKFENQNVAGNQGSELLKWGKKLAKYTLN